MNSHLRVVSSDDTHFIEQLVEDVLKACEGGPGFRMCSALLMDMGLMLDDTIAREPNFRHMKTLVAAINKRTSDPEHKTELLILAFEEISRRYVADLRRFKRDEKVYNRGPA